jgi:FKBP-type peptidyl-prolyl cis-trans isomerase
MKKTNVVLRISVILLLFAAVMTSCFKDPEDPYASYTPERETSLITSWRALMKKNNVAVDSFMVDTTKIYIIKDANKVGAGPLVKTGDKLTVSYTGKFLNGTIFDSSTSYSYTHKDSDPEKRMIPGWEACVEHLNKGAAATFMIPSALAYGTSGSYGGVIPPNTPLIFVIGVLDIK